MEFHKGESQCFVYRQLGLVPLLTPYHNATMQFLNHDNIRRRISPEYLNDFSVSSRQQFFSSLVQPWEKKPHTSILATLGKQEIDSRKRKERKEKYLYQMWSLQLRIYTRSDWWEMLGAKKRILEDTTQKITSATLFSFSLTFCSSWESSPSHL